MIRMYEKGLFITFVVGLALLIVGSIFIGIGQNSFFPVAMVGAVLVGLAETLSISLEGLRE
jgi:Na+-translocating ferredoxin:NAD+ oxidoreductase RnfD subunit